MFATVRRAILEAAEPARALREKWRPVTGAAHLLSVGKAALAMAAAAAEMLHEDDAAPRRMLVLCPRTLEDSNEAGALRGAGAEVCGCDHPLPTLRNVAAAERVAAWVGDVGEEETLVACVSGGGSAYLTLPEEGVALEGLVALTGELQRAGADIRELNAVRKHVEKLKGGRLGQRLSCAARVYVLSDVIGDPLDVIASGPFSPDASTYSDALRAVESRGLVAVAPGITERLRAGAAGKIGETPKSEDEIAAPGRIWHRVIAGNDDAIDAACAALRGMGVQVVETRRRVEGQAADVGVMLADVMSRAPAAAGDEAWVVGGEWVVDTRGQRGAGGPSQELALAWSLHSAGCAGRHLMAFSTDGVDGPTAAAGAEVSSDTMWALARAGVHAEAALAAHDSHGALARVGALLRTGPTGTNVNHVAVGLKLSED